MRHFSELVSICEHIANRRDIPASVVDWASDLYDSLTDRTATVKTEDLGLLQEFSEDQRHGLFVIDAALARRA
jgi:hypothetical protein